jgi:hypothetical protein
LPDQVAVALRRGRLADLLAERVEIGAAEKLEQLVHGADSGIH